MRRTMILLTAIILTFGSTLAQTMIQKNKIQLKSDLMTPEALWAMGRIGGYAASPDGKHIAYQVAYYSVKENKSHHILYIMDADGKNQKQLTTSAKSETDAAWLSNDRIAFCTGGEVWSMNIDGTDRKQLTKTNGEVEGYLFSPDKSKIVILKSIPYYGSIKKNPEDLPKATGRLITDMNYRHWDHYVESIAHPFLANVAADGTIGETKDILEGEPFECPTAPFGG
ncbi:MAG: peptidase S9, partial [Prevotella sp.]|nr:peptidase S9 [Prevotella sp.]